MDQNRRRETRHAKGLTVILGVDGEAYEGKTRNLSRGGAFIEVDLQIPVIVNPYVNLNFFVPTHLEIVPIACRGRICWLEGVLPNGTGFGIEFEGLNEEQISSLEMFFTLEDRTGPNVFSAHKQTIETALERWVKNGLLTRETATRYRERLAG